MRLDSRERTWVSLGEIGEPIIFVLQLGQSVRLVDLEAAIRGLRIPDEDWTRQPVDTFGLRYDTVENHGWYRNLDPTVEDLARHLEDGQLLIDYSGGTGILLDRLNLRIFDRHVGMLVVDRRTGARPPQTRRLPLSVPLSRASGATPTRAAICLRGSVPSSGSSPMRVRLRTGPTPGAERKRFASLIIGHRPAVTRGTDRDDQLRLCDVDADKRRCCRWHSSASKTRTAGIGPALRDAG